MTAISAAVDLAAAHGLTLSADGATVVEAGLDYRVVMADAHDGVRWVLRVPRRADVASGMAAEARVLEVAARALAPVAVPEWRVQTPELIAYPLLPGDPGLTLSVMGEPEWHVDALGPEYAGRLGRLLARLHAVDAEQAAAAGIEVRDPEGVRQAWRDDIARVRESFEVAPSLTSAWDEWLADDACWPDRTVLTHGEIYPGHLLFDRDAEIVGVLDWTTARADDPARDFAAHLGVAGDEMLQVALDAYAAAGGSAHAGLSAQAERLWESSPVAYGIYALTTGAEQDLATASALLDPEG